MAETRALGTRTPLAPLEWGSLAGFRPLHALMAWPSVLFLLTLAAMLFRPPDLKFYGLDRVALAVLVFVVMLRVFARRQSLAVAGPVTWPLLGLLLIALADLASQPYQAENWSVFAAKWVVPFVIYHLAQLVFEDGAHLRQLETFCLLVLAYLVLTAVCFLAGIRELIYPACILNPDIGIHADRARGPFLQAVANGVALVLLGLVAVNAYRRGRLRGVLAGLFLVMFPLAILATKTRSVWLSFAGAVAVMPLLTADRRLRRACLCLALATLAGVATLFFLAGKDTSLARRLEERSPVEFRFALYRAGWEMFQQHPVLGWAGASIQPELSRRIGGFHQDQFFFHNSYQEVTVNHGLLGLGLYFWVLWELLRAGRKHRRVSRSENLPDGLRELWPVFVGVYVLNASFVVMNYQFVNALLFAFGGILQAGNRLERRLEMDRAA